MTKLEELFGGELSVTRVGNLPDSQPDYQLTDAEYHFADIHDVMAHDDGKAKQRAEFIAEAVNNYERLQIENSKLSARIYEHNCKAIGAPIPR